MTEFEAATLAIQQASLELQRGQLWAAIAIPVVSGLVGLGQCGLIWLGLRRMGQTSDAREKREDHRAARDEARHLEAMTMLRALVQGLERQGAALERQGAALERQGVALEAALKGMGRA